MRQEKIVKNRFFEKKKKTYPRPWTDVFCFPILSSTDAQTNDPIHHTDSSLLLNLNDSYVLSKTPSLSLSLSLSLLDPKKDIVSLMLKLSRSTASELKLLTLGYLSLLNRDRLPIECGVGEINCDDD